MQGLTQNRYESKEYMVTVNEDGHLVLPADVVKKLGLEEGSKIKAIVCKDCISKQCPAI